MFRKLEVKLSKKSFLKQMMTLSILKLNKSESNEFITKKENKKYHAKKKKRWQK